MSSDFIKSKVCDVDIFTSSLNTYNHLALIRIIFKYNIYVYLGNYGYTSLHWAAQIGADQIAQSLIEYGAKINATNNEGNSALD